MAFDFVEDADFMRLDRFDFLRQREEKLFELSGGSFVLAIWDRQAEKLDKGFFLTRFRTLEGNWITRWYSIEDRHKVVTDPIPEDCDAYFSPVCYRRKRAKQDYVLPGVWLFADMDYIHPKYSPVTPTVSWNTSEDKWQAMWLIDRVMEPPEMRHLNRATCHAAGADPGTWNINRLLRIPGTENMKWRRTR